MADPDTPAASASQRAALILAAAARELYGLHRLDLARPVADMALATDSAPPNCHSVMAAILEANAEWDASLVHWRAARERAPDSPGHRFNLALALLQHGDCEAGFEAYEARLEKADWTSLAVAGSFAALRHRVPRPSDDLRGRHLVAFTEQGLGDNLWAARWLPVLAQRGARVTLLTRGVLAPVLRALPGVEAVLAAPDTEPGAKANLAAWADRCDGFVPLMTLPYLAGVSRPGELAGGLLPWLRPDPARVAAWRDRYAAAAPGATRHIGVVWRASPDNKSSPQRTMPAAALAPLAALPGVQFINLQGGAAAGRQDLAAALPGCFDALADGEPALDDYAAAIAATDLLLTVDTMALHLAGSMGHPCWVLLPFAPSFYWGTGGDGCAWYPGVRTFRQQAPGAWAGPVAAVVAGFGQP